LVWCGDWQISREDVDLQLVRPCAVHAQAEPEEVYQPLPLG